MYVGFPLYFSARLWMSYKVRMSDTWRTKLKVMLLPPVLLLQTLYFGTRWFEVSRPGETETPLGWKLCLHVNRQWTNGRKEIKSTWRCVVRIVARTCGMLSVKSLITFYEPICLSCWFCPWLDLKDYSIVSHKYRVLWNVWDTEGITHALFFPQCSAFLEATLMKWCRQKGRCESRCAN